MNAGVRAAEFPFGALPGGGLGQRGEKRQWQTNAPAIEQFDGQMRVIDAYGFDFIVQRIHAIWPSVQRGVAG